LAALQIFEKQRQSDKLVDQAKAAAAMYLLKRYFDEYRFLIDVASIQEDEKMFKSVLLRYNPDASSKDVERVKDHDVTLGEFSPILGLGKAANQSTARRFARGEVIMTIDANQDFYITEAFKLERKQDFNRLDRQFKECFPGQYKEFRADKRNELMFA